MLELAQFDKQSADALNNFNNFIKNNKSKNIDFKTIVGFWVLWNIKDSQPTYDESREIAPVIGAYLHKIINDLVS